MTYFIEHAGDDPFTNEMSVIIFFVMALVIMIAATVLPILISYKKNITYRFYCWIVIIALPIVMDLIIFSGIVWGVAIIILIIFDYIMACLSALQFFVFELMEKDGYIMLRSASRAYEREANMRGPDCVKADKVNYRRSVRKLFLIFIGLTWLAFGFILLMSWIFNLGYSFS